MNVEKMPWPDYVLSDDVIRKVNNKYDTTDENACVFADFRGQINFRMTL